MNCSCNYNCILSKIALVFLTYEVTQLILYSVEGPEGGKWERGFAHFLAGKMGLYALELGFINQKAIENENGTKI